MNRIADRPTILIVDDTPENIDILGGILRNGYHILVANSGERALDLCHRHLPDLVLLDVMMPGLDGYQVCRRLKQDPVTSDIPVMFVTAANRERDEVEGLAAGAVDFLTKPVRPPIVAARVRTHVELRQQREMLRRLSQADDLTGLANQRHFEETLARESRRCARRQGMLALLLADIDAFKAYKETYGRAAGDRSLRRVAAALAVCLGRSGDTVARLADNRFACVLPDTDLAGLRHLAERVGRDIAQLAIPHAGSGGRECLTVSVAGIVAQPGPDWILPALLPRAEELMAEAKRAGGARALVGSFESTGQPETCVFGDSRDFDPESGLRRTGGIRERYASFLGRFIAERAGDADRIEQALASGDQATARRLAHTLESVSGSLGAIGLADAAARISDRLHEGKAPTEELPRFRQELQATIREMRHLLEQTGATPAGGGSPLAAEADAGRVIGELATCLARYDAEALWLFESNRRVLEQEMTAADLRCLDAALTHFDYDSALRALRGASSGGENDNASA